MNIKSFIENQKQVDKVPRLKREYLMKYWEVVGQTFKPNYKADELTEKFINYFCSTREVYYPELIDSPKKGLFIYGNKGLGKTLNFLIYMRILHLSRALLWDYCTKNSISDVYKDERYFYLEDIKDTEISFKKDNVKHIDLLNSKRELVIDDIGTEPMNTKDYGTDKDLVADLLRLRYNKIQREYCVTHLTTNLDITDISERYGDRISDRINEMFIPILVTGTSKRN